MSENLTSMGLVTYHMKLDRKSRVQLKNYVGFKLGLSYSGVDRRFSGRTDFTKAELIAIKPIIEQELWRE